MQPMEFLKVVQTLENNDHFKNKCEAVSAPIIVEEMGIHWILELRPTKGWQAPESWPLLFCFGISC